MAVNQNMLIASYITTVWGGTPQRKKYTDFYIGHDL